MALVIEEPPEISLPFKQYMVCGTAEVTTWDGTKGKVDMNCTAIDKRRITREEIRRCINDGGFGVYSVDRARADVYAIYGRGEELRHYVVSEEFEGGELSEAKRGI